MELRCCPFPALALHAIIIMASNMPFRGTSALNSELRKVRGLGTRATLAGVSRLVHSKVERSASADRRSVWASGEASSRQQRSTDVREWVSDRLGESRVVVLHRVDERRHPTSSSVAASGSSMQLLQSATRGVKTGSDDRNPRLLCRASRDWKRERLPSIGAECLTQAPLFHRTDRARRAAASVPADPRI